MLHKNDKYLTRDFANQSDITCIIPSFSDTYTKIDCSACGTSWRREERDQGRKVVAITVLIRPFLGCNAIFFFWRRSFSLATVGYLSTRKMITSSSTNNLFPLNNILFYYKKRSYCLLNVTLFKLIFTTALKSNT